MVTGTNDTCIGGNNAFLSCRVSANPGYLLKWEIMGNRQDWIFQRDALSIRVKPEQTNSPSLVPNQASVLNRSLSLVMGIHRSVLLSSGYHKPRLRATSWTQNLWRHNFLLWCWSLQECGHPPQDWSSQSACLHIWFHLVSLVKFSSQQQTLVCLLGAAVIKVIHSTLCC